MNSFLIPHLLGFLGFVVDSGNCDTDPAGSWDSSWDRRFIKIGARNWTVGSKSRFSGRTWTFTDLEFAYLNFSLKL